MLKTDRIEQRYATRHIRVEGDDPYGDYRDMERFVGTVEDDRLESACGTPFEDGGPIAASKICGPAIHRWKRRTSI